MFIRRNRLNAVLVVGASIAMLGVAGDTALADTPGHHDPDDRCVVVRTPTTFVVVGDDGPRQHPPFGDHSVQQGSDDRDPLRRTPVVPAAGATQASNTTTANPVPNPNPTTRVSPTSPTSPTSQTSQTSRGNPANPSRMGNPTTPTGGTAGSGPTRNGLSAQGEPESLTEAWPGDCWFPHPGDH